MNPTFYVINQKELEFDLYREVKARFLRSGIKKAWHKARLFHLGHLWREDKSR